MSNAKDTLTAVVNTAAVINKAFSETVTELAKLVDEKLEMIEAIKQAMEKNTRGIYNTIRIKEPEKLAEASHTTSNTMKKQ